jgi:potassium/hydrogen antiporter
MNMTTTIIITLCILLLIAYVFDLSATFTKIPSVILLLLVGWAVKQATQYFNITVPQLAPLLPILGTIGLILIVLEGSLELDFNRNKLPFIGKTALIAFIPIIAFSFLLAFAFHYFGHINYKIALANAIPLSIISSAIAIPSAQNLVSQQKEFITYESSLSDIFGVILFNFITLNDNINNASVGHFFIELILMLIITFIATLALAFLLGKIKHHIKFIPLIVMVVLIYAGAKLFHLPALIFILLFGLFLGNISQLKDNKYLQKLQPDILNKEVHKFKDLVTEIAFSIRALFFLLFGYLIETNELLNSATLFWTIGICISIYCIRFTLLKLFVLPAKPLTYIAPRGLITILLFLSIPATQTIDLANNSLIIQVIVVTALVMMTGLMTNKKLT